MDNWLLILVFVLFLVCIVIGAVRGFFRIAISLAAAVLTVVLMVFINPLVTGAIINLTPLDTVIQRHVKQMFIPELTVDQIIQLDLSNTPFAGMNAEQLAEQLGNMQNFNLAFYGITESEVLAALGDIPPETQREIIEQAPVPQFIRNALVLNNNNLVRGVLGVDNFPDYIAVFISSMLLRILSFLITFILAIVIVRAVIVAVDIIGELPVVGFFNRLGGGIIGVGVALLIVWLFFLVITLLYANSLGITLYEEISRSEILSFLFENNIIKNRLLRF